MTEEPTGRYVTDVLPLDSGIWGLRTSWYSITEPAGLARRAPDGWPDVIERPQAKLLRQIGPHLVLDSETWTGDGLVTLFPGWPAGQWSDLAGVSAQDIWLVGDGRAHDRCGTWTMEGNVRGPSVAGATARDDAWGLQPIEGFPGQDAVMHWDGVAWSHDASAGIWKAGTLSAAGGQVWIASQYSTKLARLQAGVWTTFEAPVEFDDIVAAGDDEVWLLTYSSDGIWRGDGTSWQKLFDGDGTVIVADAKAAWIRDLDADTYLFWDGQSLHDDPSVLSVEHAARAADGALVALVETSDQPGSRAVRVRQGAGWSEPLAAPSPLPSVTSLWARSGQDVWLGLGGSTHALHLSGGQHRSFVLDDEASLALVWGDDQATYLGSSRGGIWQVARADE